MADRQEKYSTSFVKSPPTAFSKIFETLHDAYEHTVDVHEEASLTFKIFFSNIFDVWNL